MSKQVINGKLQNVLGSTDGDTVIKTSGNVYIQTRNKFYDLTKLVNLEPKIFQITDQASKVDMSTYRNIFCNITGKINDYVIQLNGGLPWNSYTFFFNKPEDVVGTFTFKFVVSIKDPLSNSVVIPTMSIVTVTTETYGNLNFYYNSIQNIWISM